MSNKTILAGFIWRFLERVGAQLVSLIVSIVLARLLSPSDYGIIALMTVFTAILQVFVDSGLANALIQKKSADDIDFSTVFFTNLLFCSILYIILFLISPVIARFYGDSNIKHYLRVLGIVVLISGVKNVQQAYVSKKMLFKKFFFSTLGGTIVAGIVGIMMALCGFGVWALIFQQITNIFIDTLILWVTVKWRPKKCFSITRLKQLLSFGWKLLASGLIDTIYSNTTQLVIGKVYSSADLAQYNRGNQFPNLIVANVNTSIDSVLLPSLSNQQDNRERIRSMTRRSIQLAVYVMAPAMIGLAAIGIPLVSLILTEKWLPSVWYMRIFCITYVFYPIHTSNLNAIKALGRSDLFLKLEIKKKIVGVIALLSTMFINIEAMTISLLFTSVAAQIINSSPSKELLNYGYRDQLHDIFPSVVLACFMGLLVYPIQFFGFSSLLTLLAQIPLGILIYILGSHLLKLEPYIYLLGIIKSLIQNRRKV